jgi:hypothetical protein
MRHEDPLTAQAMATAWRGQNHYPSALAVDPAVGTAYVASGTENTDRIAGALPAMEQDPR